MNSYYKFISKDEYSIGNYYSESGITFSELDKIYYHYFGCEFMAEITAVNPIKISETQYSANSINVIRIANFQEQKELFLTLSDEKKAEMKFKAHVFYICMFSSDIKKDLKLYFRFNASTLNQLHQSLKNYDIIQYALSLNGDAIQYVPFSELDELLCHIAVRQNGVAIRHIPKVYKTPEICASAVVKNADALKFVPKRYQKQIDALFEKHHIFEEANIDRIKSNFRYGWD